MGFVSFMGHRILGVFLAFVSLIFFLASAYYSPDSLIASTPIKIYFFIGLGVLFAIASVYFFRTQH